MLYPIRYLSPDGADGGGSVAVTVDNKAASTDGYTPPDLDLTTALPPDLRDKPYFKDKTIVDVFKEHANLQTLLGQRPAGIPKDDASDDEWNKFFSSMKPKSGDEYELPETDFSKNKGRSDDYKKAVKDIMFNANVNKRQAKAIVEGFERFLGEASTSTDTQTKEQQAARDKEFEELLDKTYAGEKQTVLERTKRLMGDLVDAGMKEKVAGVLKDAPNDVLFALTAVLDGVHKKYVAEDKVPDTGSNAGGDASSWQSEAEKLMKSDTYKDFRQPGYDEAHKRVQELFQMIAESRRK